MAEQRHLALGDGPKKHNKLVCMDPSRAVIHNRDFREIFSAFWRHYLKSLNVMKEMVRVQHASIKLWMELGGLLST